MRYLVLFFSLICFDLFGQGIEPTSLQPTPYKGGIMVGVIQTIDDFTGDTLYLYQHSDTSFVKIDSLVFTDSLRLYTSQGTFTTYIDIPTTSDSTVVSPGYGIDVTESGNTYTVKVDTNEVATPFDLSTKENTLSFTSPLSRSINTVSIPAASTSVSGHLTSTDWNTFNGKVGGTGSANKIGVWTSSSNIIFNPYLESAQGDYQLKIESDVPAGVQSGIMLKNTGGSGMRGLGIFYHDQSSGVEWFAGRPYWGNDRFTINRLETTDHNTYVASELNTLLAINPTTLEYRGDHPYYDIYTNLGGSESSPSICGYRFGSTFNNYKLASIEGISQTSNYAHGELRFNVASSISTGVIQERMRIFGNTGVVRINNLAGSGTRMVTANSSGDLSTQTIPASTDQYLNPYIISADTVGFFLTVAQDTVLFTGADLGSGEATTVGDTPTIDMTLTGVNITADVKDGSITPAKLDRSYAAVSLKATTTTYATSSATQTEWTGGNFRDTIDATGYYKVELYGTFISSDFATGGSFSLYNSSVTDAIGILEVSNSINTGTSTYSRKSIQNMTSEFINGNGVLSTTDKHVLYGQLTAQFTSGDIIIPKFASEISASTVTYQAGTRLIITKLF